MTYMSKPSFCIAASISKLASTGDYSSGAVRSPSRYCVTWRMVGLASMNGCEHSSPSLSAKHVSFSSYSPWSSTSTMPRSDPLCQCSRTRSTNMGCFSRKSCLIGRCPQMTSRMNMPNANTSVRGVTFPVHANSGARYPMVPTTRVLCGSMPWSYNRARPKSPSRAFISTSRSTLLALTSLWITICSHSS